MSDRVRIEVADRIADVRLTRPDKHNGLDFAMFEALNAAIDEVAAAPAVRAVVLHGEGPSFCAGLDFASFMAEGRPVDEMLVHHDGEECNFAQRAAYGWQRLELPVIAALQGSCIGGGAQLALAADIRIAAPDTRVSIREAHYGLIPDMGLSQSLPRLVGIDVAKELVWTARFVEAGEAVELGLITRIASDPLDAARGLATDIAARSPDAIRRAKRLLESSWNADPAAGLALEEELQRELLATPNQIEAVQAALSGSVAEFDDPDPAR